VPAPEPVTLVSFAPPAAPRWFVINDGVMGGLSQSSMQPTAEGAGLFSGTLSLENNGGFASVRTPVAPGDLSAWDGLELRVRGDGRTYQLRLRTDDRFDGVAYRAEFPTLNGAWATVRLPFGDFLPTFRGRILTDVPPLDLNGIEQVGLMLADKQAGKFALEVEFVRTYVGAD
jgi:NADH dehydrogenase [ubiquinone] 1 alpha subcomplex assembly factor 1